MVVELLMTDVQFSFFLSFAVFVVLSSVTVVLIVFHLETISIALNYSVSPQTVFPEDSIHPSVSN